MPDAKRTILLAAGGTGGHLFPAEALAQELLARGHRVVIVTDKRGNAFKSLGDRVDIHIVRAATLRAGVMNKVRAIVDMSAGIIAAIKLLKKIKPDVVVGFGGYPSFPGVFAGQRLGIPTILHEQNAVLGKANKWLANKAEQIAVSLPGTVGIAPANKDKVITTGNPVRAEIVAVRETQYQQPAEDLRIFVTGGSQAAKVFADVLPEAVGKMSPELKQRLSIVHQCREDDIAPTQAKYQGAGVKAEIKSFFNDMADRLKNCHLFIGRSGASTVAEIATVGRPAIFVPYPGHKDMQQKFNAEVVSNRGGGWVILQDNFKPDAVADKLTELMTHPSALTLAAAAAKSCGQPDAARNLADVVEKKIATLKR
jgi:UDP-N-acetylglucosamine--N-acetylmuramyl-(pentapeptide) pyrophosphoryl-undecaprenol N-acetylglucosamine transferase